MVLCLKARDKGTKLINEKGLFSLIEAAPDPDAAAEPAPVAASSHSAAASRPTAHANGAASKPDLAAASLAASGDLTSVSPSANNVQRLILLWAAIAAWT